VAGPSCDTCDSRVSHKMCETHDADQGSIRHADRLPYTHSSAVPGTTSNDRLDFGREGAR
jgi:hypothetical protein